MTVRLIIRPRYVSKKDWLKNFENSWPSVYPQMKMKWDCAGSPPKSEPRKWSSSFSYVTRSTPKLYLLYLPHPINPIVGYLGSSNLTFAGLSKQGELNVDVLDHDACKKLAKWFEDRWNDRWCIDISDELAQIIEQSWAREDSYSRPTTSTSRWPTTSRRKPVPGLSEFRIPRDFGDKLFDYQTAAVKIAAHHLNKRGGVLDRRCGRLGQDLDGYGLGAHL